MSSSPSPSPTSRPHPPSTVYTLLTIPITLLTTLLHLMQRILPSTRSPLPPVPNTCRYSLDNSRSHTLLLPDRRHLGYATFGPTTISPTTKTILYMHGLPGSRLEIAFLEPHALRLNVQIIAVDRPGYGWSSPHPGRSILDHARDVEYLTEQLGLTEYGVLGLSGGGPYTLACARVLPAEKLRAVSIVCGLGPREAGYGGMRWTNWVGFAFGFRVGYPWLMSLFRWWVRREPGGRLELTDKERLEMVRRGVEREKRAGRIGKDEVFYDDVDRMKLYLRSSRQAFGQGAEGFAQDGALLAGDFGFRVEDIREDLTVQLWYGKRDVFVPPEHGDYIAAKLGGGAELRLEDETHASLEVNFEKEYLEALVAAM